MVALVRKVRLPQGSVLGQADVVELFVRCFKMCASRYLRKKAKSDPRQQLIKLGSPLPQMGACRHFKKSYKLLGLPRN